MPCTTEQGWNAKEFDRLRVQHKAQSLNSLSSSFTPYTLTQLNSQATSTIQYELQLHLRPSGFSASEVLYPVPL